MIQHSEATLKTASGVELFSQSWKPSQPKAVVLLSHGLGEHSGRYPNLIPELTKRNYAIYACDHRGHGRTAGPRATIDTWNDFRDGIKALVAWAKSEQPGFPLILYGHSLGGLIALDYALTDSSALQGLVLSAPALSSDGISPVVRLISRLLSRVAPNLLIKNGLPIAGISRDPVVQAAYTADPLNHAYGTPRLATESFTAIAAAHANAGHLRLPLLIIHGEADPIVPPESSARFFANAGSADKQRISYPGVVHEAHNDHGWQTAVGDIADWMDRHV